MTAQRKRYSGEFKHEAMCLVTEQGLSMAQRSQMRLCIVTQRIKMGDGQGRVNFEIIKAALEHRHHVTVLSNELDGDLRLHPRITWIRVPGRIWPTQLLRDLSFALYSDAWLRGHASNIDLIQTNGAIMNHKSDINVVHFVHSTWQQSPAHTARSQRNLYGTYQWLYTMLHTHWEKRAFERTQTLVAISRQVAADLSHQGIAAHRIRTILNGVDLEEFYPGNSNRANWGLPTDVPIGLFAGDMKTPRKNLDTVLHALVHVPNLHLAIAGNTGNSQGPRLCAALGIETRVHFLGQLQSLAEIMRAVDLFVYPSRYEPFGLVVIEAMASGLPIITASTTGASQLVDATSGFVLADPTDVTGLAIALDLLARNPAQRRQMGQAARLIAEQHSWHRMAQQYLDLLEEYCH